MTGLRMNRAVLSLVRDHGMALIDATNVGCALERAKADIAMFTLLLRYTRIPAGNVRAWLEAHGYIATTARAQLREAS